VLSDIILYNFCKTKCICGLSLSHCVTVMITSSSYEYIRMMYLCEHFYFVEGEGIIDMFL
jgi:hypothetical protein